MLITHVDPGKRRSVADCEQVALSGYEERAALLVGLDLALYIGNRLKVYFDFLVLLLSTLATQNFEKGLTELYALVLRFLASAVLAMRRNSATRLLQPLWQPSSLSDFETECDKWAARLDVEAQLCEHESSVQWRLNLEK